ncbi:MAG: hypothetical protein NTV97_11615 [Alphaproteobacteria bacterium]|nr:hypothetical protein [Alphaproteobacteria bacterium]
MKLYLAGEKSVAICDADGRVSTTFKYRDVPFSDSSGTAKQILVGVCDRCGKVVSIPPQSTPAIKASRTVADVPIEAMLPAVYLDALDLACYRIDPSRLLLYYLHRSSRNKTSIQRLARAIKRTDKIFSGAAAISGKRRLSMKVSPAVSRMVDLLAEATKSSKTDLIKGTVVQIREGIVEPVKPEHLVELRTLAMLANC